MNNIQVIMQEGQPQYAVLPWNEYQALLKAAGQRQSTVAPAAMATPAPSQATAPQESLTLAQLRHKTGLTPELLAQALGISPSYWQMIEAGERQASEVVLRNLRRLANVTIE
ncbi:helix-turn-helix domain-containing protein [Thiopseudomonas alkaliphila]|uniref:helix-turn-helix domain-containing protein n=1 Tax=Thiopseudomonas alkaliphila TaxID=1697053 RepID=UPI0035716507